TGSWSPGNLIRDLRQWNVALSPAEVAELFNPPPAGITIGPVGNIASAETFGAATVTVGAPPTPPTITIGPVGGIASAQAFGIPTITGGTAPEPPPDGNGGSSVALISLETNRQL